MTDVRKRTAAVEKMAEHWPMLDALLEGTSAMRKAREAYLPKMSSEEEVDYCRRVGTATLFPAFSRTVEILAAKPFSKPLTLGDDVPSRIRGGEALPGWADDIDMQGRSLHVFAASLTDSVVSHGLAGILVEYPRAEGVRTQADEKRVGARPYFVHIHCTQILGWRARVVAGKWVLNQLRIVEIITEDDGEFGEKHIEQVRVLTPGKWETYRKKRNATTNADEWAPHEEGATSISEIPFVAAYGKRTGFMTALPPLLELAHMNVKHWQSQSDQDTIEHFARVPILAIVGGDDDSKITIGGSMAIRIPLGGDAKFVEHTGAAIESGANGLQRLEDQMRQAGAELLVIKPGNTSESQTLADNEQGKCALQRIVEDVEDAIDQALHLMSLYVNESTGGHVELFKDFGALSLAEASAELLLKSAQAGKISDETYRGELRRRGILSPDLVEAEEVERIGDQPPPLGTIPPDPDPENGNGE